MVVSVAGGDVVWTAQKCCGVCAIIPYPWLFSRAVLMARLPGSGATFLTPFENGQNPRALDENDLRSVLLEVCPDVAFTAHELHGYYLDLGLIIGRWYA